MSCPSDGPVADVGQDTSFLETMVVPPRRADAAAHRDVIHRLQEKGLCRIKQLLSKNGVDFIEQFLLELLKDGLNNAIRHVLPDC